MLGKLSSGSFQGRRELYKHTECKQSDKNLWKFKQNCEGEKYIYTKLGLKQEEYTKIRIMDLNDI